jgi:hypothetical protein
VRGGSPLGALHGTSASGSLSTGSAFTATAGASDAVAVASPRRLSPLSALLGTNKGAMLVGNAAQVASGVPTSLDTRPRWRNWNRRGVDAVGYVEEKEFASDAVHRDRDDASGGLERPRSRGGSARPLVWHLGTASANAASPSGHGGRRDGGGRATGSRRRRKGASVAGASLGDGGYNGGHSGDGSASAAWSLRRVSPSRGVRPYPTKSESWASSGGFCAALGVQGTLVRLAAMTIQVSVSSGTAADVIIVLLAWVCRRVCACARECVSGVRRTSLSPFVSTVRRLLRSLLLTACRVVQPRLSQRVYRGHRARLWVHSLRRRVMAQCSRRGRRIQRSWRLHHDRAVHAAARVLARAWWRYVWRRGLWALRRLQRRFRLRSVLVRKARARAARTRAALFVQRAFRLWVSCPVRRCVVVDAPACTAPVTPLLTSLCVVPLLWNVSGRSVACGGARCGGAAGTRWLSPRRSRYSAGTAATSAAPSHCGAGLRASRSCGGLAGGFSAGWADCGARRCGGAWRGSGTCVRASRCSGWREATWCGGVSKRCVARASHCSAVCAGGLHAAPRTLVVAAARWWAASCAGGGAGTSVGSGDERWPHGGATSPSSRQASRCNAWHVDTRHEDTCWACGSLPRSWTCCWTVSWRCCV